MKSLKKIIIGIFVVTIFVVCAGTALAVTTTPKKSAIIPDCLLSNDWSQIKGNPSCDNLNIFIWLAINIGKYLFTFIGALALMFFVYGGFMLIISQGNPEKIKQGTGAMVAAVAGLIVAFSAYALISFLSNTIKVKEDYRLNNIELIKFVNK